MIRTYCKIIGTREQDYTGNRLAQGISQEMTVFSGGASVPYTEDVIRAARDVFQLYGAKTAYSNGVFSSVMRSVSGQAFVCYGISQKQALGRDAQFTQLFVTPREELLDGDAFRQEVLCHDLIGEEAIHRLARPSQDEVFRTQEYARYEVNGLDERRLKTLMRAATLLCSGKRVLLIERDETKRKDYFRPVLRELFELIPAGHRYQIDVTTGRGEDDIERLGSAQLIVTDQSFGNALDRQQLRLDMDENITLTSGEQRWSHLTNAERDKLSAYVGGSNITLQTEFTRLMDCMDDDKSFWWASDNWDNKFSSYEELFKRHESTPILGLPEINKQFCERLPRLMTMKGGYEDYYFDLRGNSHIPKESRDWCLGYLTRGKLRKFGLSDEEFSKIETNYANYDNTFREVQALHTAIVGDTPQNNGLQALLDSIRSWCSGIFRRKE